MRSLKARVTAAATSLNLLMLAALAHAQTTPGPDVAPGVGTRSDASSMWGWVIGAAVLLAILYALTRRRGAPRP